MSRRARKADSQRSGLTFAAIPHVVLASYAWRSLSLRARAILIEIVAKHKGWNNGAISASQRELAAAIGTTSFRDIGAAIVELMNHGLLDIEVGSRTWERKAREYRITWLPTGEPPNRKPAGNEWRAFLSADAVSAEKGVSADTASAAPRILDDTASARILDHRRKSAISQNRPC